MDMKMDRKKDRKVDRTKVKQKYFIGKPKRMNRYLY